MKDFFKKNKNALVLIIVVILLSQLNAIAYGALEVEYPNIPGAPTDGPHKNSFNLFEYIDYAFIFIVMTAGIIGIISIVVSGLQILVFAGSPAAISAARERIFGAIFGIILLFFSVLLLRTINPDLLKVRKIEEALGTGLYYQHTKEGELHLPKFVYSPIPQSEPDIFTTSFNDFFFPEEIQKLLPSLFYKCNSPNDKPILIWLYNLPNFQLDLYSSSYLSVETVELGCGEKKQLSQDVRSLRWNYKKTGAYFYIEDNCKGLSSNAYKESGKITDFDNLGIGGDLGTSDKLTVRSFKIVNGASPKLRYALVLNKNPERNGLCTAPYIWPDAGESQCYSLTFSEEIAENAFQDVDFDPRFAYVLNFNPEWQNKNKTGISIFSDHFATGIPADDVPDPSGVNLILIKGIKNYYTTIDPKNPDPTHGNPDNLLLSRGGIYTLIPNIRVPLEKECTEEDLDTLNTNEEPSPENPGPIQQVILAATRRTCLKRIEILNPYYVILYGRNYFTEDDTCQVFNDYNKKSFNPKEEDILSAYRKLYRMDIIPRAQ